MKSHNVRAAAAAATAYISELVTAYPGIREVWLLGSRANWSAKAESDWDYLAFADDATLAALRDDLRFRRGGIDLMIVTDGDKFAAPWTDHNGRLAKVDGGWHWERLSPDEATYRATKWPKFAGFEQRATRVYPDGKSRA